MRKLILCLLLCTMVQAADAQRVSRSYKDKPMSKVLVDLRRTTKQYKISFIHNELEDYTVTKSFTEQTIPEAIRECIGFYPITMKVEGDSLIFVEAMLNTESKLIGRLVDSKRQPVSYANITLLNVGDSAIVSSGVSNENGDFVIPTTERQLRIRISCVGYQTLVLNCETGDVGTITLQETTEHLDEVVVEGDLHISKPDREVYIPNQRQRGAANSGFGLLANLGIPQIDINPITRSLKSISGQALSLYIDGREVSQQELEEIRPKDILRVEFIDTPTGPYAGKELVLNFIMRQYEYGGYVMAKDLTRFVNTISENAVQVNLDHKRMHYSLLASCDYRYDRHQREQKEEDITTGTQAFHRSNDINNDPMKEWRHFGRLRASYRGKKLKLTGTAGLQWTQQPQYASHQAITYSGDVNEQTTATRTRDSRDIDPSFNVDMDYKPNDRQQLKGGTYFRYGNHHYNTLYAENGYEVNTFTKEHMQEWITDMRYVHRLGAKNSFTLNLTDYYMHFDDRYTGTTVSRQKLYENELLVFPMLNLYVGSRCVMNLRPLGFSVSHWGTENYHYHYLNSRFATTVRYTLNMQNNLNFAVYLGNNYPSPSSTSELELTQNRYETLRGNPEVGRALFETQYFTYNLSLKNYQLSATVRHEGIHNIIHDQELAEGDRLIHTFVSSGSINDLSLITSQTLFLLNRKLQLRNNLELWRNIVTGTNTGTLNTIRVGQDARYYLGDFSFYAFVRGPYKSFGFNDYGSPAYYKKPAYYGASASYGHKGLYAEMGFQRQFANKDYVEAWRQSNLYSFVNHNYQEQLKPWFYVRLSYTLDFGRKTQHDDIQTTPTQRSSAILGR